MRHLARAADRVNGTSNSTALASPHLHRPPGPASPSADPGLAQVRHVVRRILPRRGQVRQLPFFGLAPTCRQHAGDPGCCFLD